MSPRSCRVTIRDLEGVEHTVHVTASSLYEAVALGIASLRSQEWVAGIPEGMHPVRVSVTDIPVEHSVKLSDFNAWLRKEGGTPRDRASRYKVKEILGVALQK
jgi:hypothetical protein